MHGRDVRDTLFAARCFLGGRTSAAGTMQSSWSRVGVARPRESAHGRSLSLSFSFFSLLFRPSCLFSSRSRDHKFVSYFLLLFRPRSSVPRRPLLSCSLRLSLSLSFSHALLSVSNLESGGAVAAIQDYGISVRPPRPDRATRLIRPVFTRVHSTRAPGARFSHVLVAFRASGSLRRRCWAHAASARTFRSPITARSPRLSWHRRRGRT